MTIVLICLAITCWIACALITAGVMLHYDHDEWEGSEVLLVFTCLLGWWLLASISCGYLILKQLAKVPLFIAGFLDAVTRRTMNNTNMSNKFYETFFPTEEDLQRFKEEAEKLDKEVRERKHCVVCSHYTYDASVPEFVTYEGDCDMGHAAFFGDYPDGPCPDWNGKDANKQ